MIHGEISLRNVRAHFETLSGSDFDSKFVSDTLCVLGILTGYRVLHFTDEFKEIEICLSQGGNEELRLYYTGIQPDSRESEFYV